MDTFELRELGDDLSMANLDLIHIDYLEVTLVGEEHNINNLETIYTHEP
jgi:hypothetical protein